MKHPNLFLNYARRFAELCKKYGWTEEEILEVLKAVQEEMRNDVRWRRPRFIKYTLKKHAMLFIERKRREQELQNKHDL